MSSIHLDWADENHNILLLTFQSDWTWREFNNAGDRAVEMMQTVNHPVVQIFDMRDAPIIPRNAFSNGRHLLNRRPHPNLENVIVVGMNGYFNAIFRAFEKMVPASWIDKWNMVFMDSLEEAVKLANQVLENTTAI